MTFDPQEIGRRRPPVQTDPDEPYMDAFEQDEYDSLSQGYEEGLIAEMQKCAADHPETRKHLIPLLKKAQEMHLEADEAMRVACFNYQKQNLTPQRWASFTCLEKYALLKKVAHKPILEREGLNRNRVKAGEAFMVYLIDATMNKSKFYEGMVVPDEGGYRIIRRWGAMTDSGRTGRIDGTKFDYDRRFLFDDLNSAKRELQKHYAKRVGHGYIDAFGSRHVSPVDGSKLPQGQYPVGLTRETGFGWGSQSVTVCIPGLRELQMQISTAMDTLKGGLSADAAAIEAVLDAAGKQVRLIAGQDSTMARKIDGYLDKAIHALVSDDRTLFRALTNLNRYLAKQLSYCS